MAKFKINNCFFGLHNWNEGYKTIKDISAHSEHKVSIYCRECKEFKKIQLWNNGYWETYNNKSK